LQVPLGKASSAPGYIIIEVGSGSGTFALAVYHTGKGKVGVYTIDCGARVRRRLLEELVGLVGEEARAVEPPRVEALPVGPNLLVLGEDDEQNVTNHLVFPLGLVVAVTPPLPEDRAEHSRS
jgi:hypothetical protein